MNTKFGLMAAIGAAASLNVAFGRAEDEPHIRTLEKVSADRTVSYSEFVDLIDGSLLRSAIIIQGYGVLATEGSGASSLVYIPYGADTLVLADRLAAAGVDTSFADYEPPLPAETVVRNKRERTLDLIFNLVPFLIFLVFIAFVVYFVRHGNKKYYADAEKVNSAFLDRLEKILLEAKRND